MIFCGMCVCKLGFCVLTYMQFQGTWRAGLVVDFLPEAGLHTVIFLPSPTGAAAALEGEEEARDLCLAKEEVGVTKKTQMPVKVVIHSTWKTSPHAHPSLHIHTDPVARDGGFFVQAGQRRWQCWGQWDADGDGAVIVRPGGRGHAVEGVVGQGPGLLLGHRHGVGRVSD